MKQSQTEWVHVEEEGGAAGRVGCARSMRDLVRVLYGADLNRSGRVRLGGRRAAKWSEGDGCFWSELARAWWSRGAPSSV